MRIVDATPVMVRAFLVEAGTSLRWFRYYHRRDVPEAMRAHACTLVGFEDGSFEDEDERPVAYGHLDVAGPHVWLGICVAEDATGAGVGRQMMSRLVSIADADRRALDLAVDVDNWPAIHLYEAFGFKRVRTEDSLLFMRREEVSVDTAGSLVDKLCTVDQKLFHNQELLYEIRRMTFDEFRSKYMSDDGMRTLWEVLKKACDLNVQRHQLIEEFDRKLVETVRAVSAGTGEHYVQPQHKTY